MIVAVLMALSAQTDTASAAQQPVAAAQTASSQEAYVSVRFEADESGTIDKCEVVSTSAPKELSDKVCPIFLSKVIEPQKDKDGVAQRQTRNQTIRFVIED